MIIIVMGVTGSGKSTLARGLATQLGWLCLEADAFHPEANVRKMSRGQALDDDDRAPWLDALNRRLREQEWAGAVLACSALSADHRRRLTEGLSDARFVHLAASRELLERRLSARRGHFAGPALLDSQLAALEPPPGALTIDAARSPASKLAAVLDHLELEATRTVVATTVVEGLAFPEGPRWHQGEFWFTDQHARTVSRLDRSDGLTVVLRTADLPGGLAWLPDGTALVVQMTERRLLTVSDRPREYVDLSRHASFHLNDLVAAPDGRLYLGNFGFDLHRGEAPRPAEVHLVRPDRSIELFASEVVFPNGSVLTPDLGTLLLAETFAHRITAFSLDAGGREKDRRCWAALGARTPDGICFDAEGALWIASPGTSELVRVAPGGRVLARCRTEGTPYACALGGPDRRELYACTAQTDDPTRALSLRSGRIERAFVDAAGAGYP